jgi:hypothetical protein
MAIDKSLGSFDAPLPRLGLAQDDKFRNSFWQAKHERAQHQRLQIFLDSIPHICKYPTDIFSSEQVAKKLRITGASLSRYISAGKLPMPQTATAGGMTIYQWTEEDVKRAQEMLPKIANGRKTRHKKQSAVSTQQSAKAKKQKKNKKKNKKK